MVKRTKWKGWLKPDEVEPELHKRILTYNERYEYHVSKKGISESFAAHQSAAKEVPLTAEELDIKKRLLD